MSSKRMKALSESAFKKKLEQMGMSFNRTDQVDNYYEKMYINASNAKSKVTRNNTPFYKEGIINRKRERERELTTEKKKKINNKQHYKENSLLNEEDSDKEEKEKNSSRKRKHSKTQNSNIKNNENDIKDNSSGIKITRLIMSKQKKDKNINKNDNPFNRNEILNKLRSPRTRRNGLNDNKNKRDDDFIYYDEGYSTHKSKSKPKNKKSNKKNSKGKDKKINKNNQENIITISAQNDNYDNKHETLRSDNKEKDYYLDVREKNINKEIEQLKENSNDIENNLEKDQNQENNEYTDMASDYSASTSRFSRFTEFSVLSFRKIGNGFVNMKNSVMNKFKRNAYLFPLIILILFGIVFFWNERYENFERRNIIIIFSIIMGLIVLFHLCKCLNEIRKYKKMAKEDKKKLMELLEKNDIKKEDIGNNIILLKEFFEEVIGNRGLDYDVYMKNVFPYLVKYLKRDGYILEIQKDEENDGNNLNYWKRM